MSLGIARSQDRIGVDSYPGGGDACSSSGDDILEGWTRGALDQHSAEVLLQGLASSCSPSRELIAYGIGNVADGDSNTHDASLAALQPHRSQPMFSQVVAGG